MTTNRQFISKIRGILKSLNIDDRISGRLILQTGRDYVQDLLANRQLQDIFRDNSFSTLLECFPMKKIDKVKCDIAEFRLCESIMKSEKQVPELFNSKIGLSIVSVFNIDRTVRYEPIRDLADFINESKREFGGKLKYFFVSGGYLYILNSETEIVHIEGLFVNEKEVLEASECFEDKDCLKLLDMDFKCPARYVGVVTDQTAKLLASTVRNIIEDENPDGDSNQKTASPQGN